MSAKDSGTRRCGATGKTSGRPCGNELREFQLRCDNHGGASPQALAAEQRRATAAKAAVLARTFSLTVETTPTEALLEEVNRTAGNVRWYEAVIRELEPEALTWGRTQEVSKEATEFPGVDRTEAAAVNVYVDLWMRERAHLVKVCSAALSAGIEERRVRLAESQGQLLADVIRRVLDALGLDERQQQLVPTVVPAALRMITGGGP